MAKRAERVMLWAVVVMLVVVVCFQEAAIVKWRHAAETNDQAATECEQRSGQVPNGN